MSFLTYLLIIQQQGCKYMKLHPDIITRSYRTEKNKTNLGKHSKTKQGNDILINEIILCLNELSNKAWMNCDDLKQENGLPIE